MARAKRSAESVAARREALVAAARAVIAEEGLAGVTARGLAARLGWSVGAIYTVAPSLDAVTLEANAAELDALHAALAAEIRARADAPPRDRAQALAATYLAFTEARPRSWAAIFEREADPAGGPPDWYAARQTALFELLETALAPLAGAPAEARWAARALWAALQGFLALSMAGHVDRVSEDPETGARQDLAVYLVDVLIAGLEARRRGGA